MIYLDKKINSINSLIIEIEQDFNESYSVIAYDLEGLIWLEKFADNMQEAEKLAKKLEKKFTKPFTYN
jgi:superfamily II helicase